MSFEVRKTLTNAFALNVNGETWGSRGAALRHLK